MKKIVSVLFFYKKIFIPTIALSIVFGFIMSDKFSLASVGFAYIFISLLFHFVIYELRNPNEYYFYYNIGLNKISLWICSALISCVIGIIFMTL
ncbi:MAG: hypothetical protein JEZ09_11780 [Salinivirgaceae bacterium]|nr:hypothetical protein [Salinivirgaceae bacterium]